MSKENPGQPFNPVGEKLTSAIKEKKADLDPNYKGDNPKTSEETIKDLEKLGFVKDKKTKSRKKEKSEPRSFFKHTKIEINRLGESMIDEKRKMKNAKNENKRNAAKEKMKIYQKGFEEAKESLKRQKKQREFERTEKLSKQERNKPQKEQQVESAKENVKNKINEKMQETTKIAKDGVDNVAYQGGVYEDIKKAESAGKNLTENAQKEVEKTFKYIGDDYWNELDEKSKEEEKETKGDLKTSSEIAMENTEYLVKNKEEQLFPETKEKDGQEIDEEIKEKQPKKELAQLDLFPKEEWAQPDLFEPAATSEIKLDSAPEKKRDWERIETVKSLKEKLTEAREKFALADKIKNPTAYEKNLENYKSQTDAFKLFLYEAKKSTLEKKGLNPEEINKELEKYSKEAIIPHFAVVEAANIQSLKSEAEPSRLKMIKDSKWTKGIYNVVDKYRKLPFGKKMLISGGLIAGGLGAGFVGGAIGATIAGAAFAGKWAQRILGGAGTGIATEAFIQKKQNKWLAKEGWGKNRHEFVAVELGKIRKKERETKKLKKEGKETEWMRDVENQLKEREALEKKFEIRRAILGGLVGVVFGSGAAWQAIKQWDEWLLGGHGARILTEAGQYWKGKIGLGDKSPEAPIKPLSPKTPPTSPEEFKLKGLSPEEQQKIISEEIRRVEPISSPAELKDLAPKGAEILEIGKRGPEGAIIDYLKTHLETAQKLGLVGDSGKIDLLKTGNFAHKIFLEDMKEAFSKSETLETLKKFGFPKNEEGYLKMMTRIGKGFVNFDPNTGKIDLVDMEYLKALKREVVSKVSEVINPDISFYNTGSLYDKMTKLPSYLVPERPEMGDFPVETMPWPEEIIPDVLTEQVIDTAKLSAVEDKIAPVIEEQVAKYREMGLKSGKILEQIGQRIKETAEKAGISPEELKEVLKPEGIQEILDSRDGKIGGMLSNLGIKVEKFVDSLNKIFPVGIPGDIENKMGQLMNMDAYELYKQARNIQSGPLISFTTKLRELNGFSADDLKGYPVRRLIDSIYSSKIFGGTAKELIDKNIR